MACAAAQPRRLHASVELVLRQELGLQPAQIARCVQRCAALDDLDCGLAVTDRLASLRSILRIEPRRMGVVIRRAPGLLVTEPGCEEGALAEIAELIGAKGAAKAAASCPELLLVPRQELAQTLAWLDSIGVDAGRVVSKAPQVRILFILMIILLCPRPRPPEGQ